MDRCPDALWQEPVGREPFCRVVFHTLFFADLYLSSDEQAFRRQEYHRQHEQLFVGYEQLQDCDPIGLYDRPDLLDYLEFCRRKACRVFTAETESSLAAPCGFPRRNFSPL